MDKKPICFVIMGFGKKTDFLSGKTYDLDQTYKNIIKPSVINSGYECVRADEIRDSGLIDKSMYVLLMQSDLVIADITTYNPNAIYELGIRHAVRPFSTIILKEKDGKIPFDLDHTRMFAYTHLGEDIGVDESERCQKELTKLIGAVSVSKEVDSPLYGYITNVTPPTLPTEEYFSIIDSLAEQEKHIFAVVEKAKNLKAESKFGEAVKYWEKASKMIESEPYFVQQHALCLYKSAQDSLSVLTDALTIIKGLNEDDSSNDPETLGITGAIYKQSWIISDDKGMLNKAIESYGKCFKIREDYYTGENYALCLDIKSHVEEDDDEKTYCRIEAKKTRQKIVENLIDLIEIDGIESRLDRKWIYATLSHCQKALGKEYLEYEEKFFAEDLVGWEKDTYETNKELLKKYHG